MQKNNYFPPPTKFKMHHGLIARKNQQNICNQTHWIHTLSLHIPYISQESLIAHYVYISRISHCTFWTYLKNLSCYVQIWAELKSTILKKLLNLFSSLDSHMKGRWTYTFTSAHDTQSFHQLQFVTFFCMLRSVQYEEEEEKLSKS